MKLRAILSTLLIHAVLVSPSLSHAKDTADADYLACKRFLAMAPSAQAKAAERKNETLPRYTQYCRVFVRVADGVAAYLKKSATEEGQTIPHSYFPLTCSHDSSGEIYCGYNDGNGREYHCGQFEGAQSNRCYEADGTPSDITCTNSSDVLSCH